MQLCAKAMRCCCEILHPVWRTQESEPVTKGSECYQAAVVASDAAAVVTVVAATAAAILLLLLLLPAMPSGNRLRQHSIV